MEEETLKSLHLKGNGWLRRQDNRLAGENYGRPSPRERERESALADWVGQERRAEVFAELRPDAVSAGNLAAAFLSSIPVQSITLLEGLKRDWQSIVGEVNLPHCHPASISGKTLRIDVYDSTWLYILKGQSAVFLGRLQAYSHGEIQAIAFSAAARRKR